MLMTLARKEQLRDRAQDMRETPDQTPVEIPVSMQRPLTLEERMRAFIQAELSQAAQASGAGSFDEEDDFDEEDPEAAILSDNQISLLVQDFAESLDGEDPPPSLPDPLPGTRPGAAADENVAPQQEADPPLPGTASEPPQ